MRGVDYNEAKQVALARNPNATGGSVTREDFNAKKKTNYQKFYPTQFPSLLDPNVGQPTGYVTKDGMN